jgi:opacity protein-like surface antigen
MRKKACFEMSLALFFLCSAFSAHAQVEPITKATEDETHFAIGAGFSGYSPDQGKGHLLGGTLWMDYTPGWGPSLLRGISIEAQARDLNYGRSSSESPNLREEVAEGGAMYSWRGYRNFRPYGKFLVGYGNRNASGRTGYRFHDSRTITAAGGGLEFRAAQHVWVRADYEYQFWPDMVFNNKTGKPRAQIHPQGLTVGVLYHFNRPHFR